VIVVEGFFDALKVHQARHPTVVALMGASFSQRQSELLLSHFASVTLMLDGDETGRRGAEVIAQLLMSNVPVGRVELPDGVQPDLLSSAELHALLGSANPTS
jgi:DNA primase